MILVKVGGGKNINWDGVCQDIARLRQKTQVLFVHGASASRDELAQRLGIPCRTIVSPSGISSVFTDEKALDVFLMAYAGLVNKRVVVLFQRYGVSAVGLSGVDGRLWLAKRKEQILAHENGRTKLLKGNLTGRVEEVNTHLLKLLLKHDYLPVICPPAISYDDEIVNTDGDGAASVLAKFFNIRKLVVLFEAPGLLRDPDDSRSLIRNISKKRIDEYMPFARGRMKRKILGAKAALEHGVEKVCWGDGRVPHPVQAALEGQGTVIT